MLSPPVVYRTKVDLWLVLILVGAAAVSLWAVVVAFRTDPAAAWLTLGLVVVSFALVAALAIPTEYTLTDSELIIRGGMISTRISFDSIQRVYPTSNPLSAPAWSLDRVGIQYLRGTRRRLALISPDDRVGFMGLLAERANLERAGTTLVRGAAGEMRAGS